MAFKMKAGKEGPMKKNFGSMISSPMDKELVGNQHRLPDHLKKKIEAAPESPNKLKDTKVTVTDKDTGKKIDKATGRPVGETALEFMKKERVKGQPPNVRPIQRKVRLDPKKITKVERSEKSKRMEDQRKTMKKQ